MIRFLLVVFLFVLLTSSHLVLAIGENCAAPIPVTVSCPSLTLSSQTSAGMQNDYSSWKYNSFGSYFLSGEDMVYEITFPTGSTELLVSMIGANKYGYIFTSTTCVFDPLAVHPARYFSLGNTANISISLPNTGNKIYLYLDHSGASNLTFDIAFGVVTIGPYINIPNTRGALNFSSTSCISPSFVNYLDFYKDGAKLLPPTTFGPFAQTHDYCFTFFLRNLTGIEGPKSFKFTFNNFTNVSVTNGSVAGTFESGFWVASVVGNVVTWNFQNATNPTRGDFNGIASNCMRYDFCINATPISVAANIDYWITGDGKGQGYSGYTYSGCTAGVPSWGYYGATGYSPFSGSAAGFGGGINAGGLPVDFINLWLSKDDSGQKVNWQTSHELNLKHYVLQYSESGYDFRDIETVLPLKNTGSTIETYTSTVSLQSFDKGFFRIKTVDQDGTIYFSKMISNTITSEVNQIYTYPNPVTDILHIKSLELIREISLYSFNGDCVYRHSIGTMYSTNEFDYDVRQYPKRIYLLQVSTDKGIDHIRLIKE